MSDEIVKRADNILSHWASSTRANSRIGTEVKISSIYTKATATKRVLVVEEHVLEYVDHIIGQMTDPIRRVMKRYYLDPTKKGGFYPVGSRTIKEKAKHEQLSEHNFNDYLKIGRHITHQKLQDAKFI